MYVAPNPRPAPFAWESGRGLALAAMVRDEPVRTRSASERATTIARAKQLLAACPPPRSRSARPAAARARA
ncbi:hypothetical protein [Streptomyces sp. NBC_01262]|uniref:hypothetical protein n=1 Tax=Streptomyces sp. NBC_01262 TaxID=2903803 RepID=UPI002E32D50C|nr:hypothetical protein [Streptomyces sp. NBC_01262]